MKISVVQFGLGEIGKEITRLVLNQSQYELVGAVEIDESKVDRELSEILDLPKETGITVTDDPGKVLSDKPDLAFHSTASAVSDTFAQLKKILESGTNIISTSEELSYPYLQNQEKAEELDNIATGNGATLFGTGVNPGFAMDLLPLTFTGIARELEKITVKRVQNASFRRRALQTKIGVGLSEDEFNQKVRKQGGHVGLLESVSLLATGLGWRLDEIKESTEPVIARERVETDYFTASPGEARGINQTARGFVDGKEKINLNLQMYAGAQNPVDQINLFGVPEVSLKVPGGIHGDIATPAIAVNSARKVLEEDPGLLTLLDIYPFLYNFE